MFNLARRKREGQSDIPMAYKQEDALFNSKSKQQNMTEDITALKRIMVENGLKDPDDAVSMVESVGHWQYLKEFRPKYLKDICHKAILPAEQLAEEFYQHPEKFPLPQPPQGGQGGAPGGAPPPAMAAAEKQAKYGTFVMPDGTILLKEENEYMANVNGDKVEFYSEAPIHDAMKIAMIRIAAKGNGQAQRK